MCRVSVIVPNYNHGAFLEKRLRSIFAQTFQDYELIYLDDCSTDNSNQQFYNFMESVDGKVTKVILNENNSGSTFRQWNRGIKQASGDYVWLAESDDWAGERLLDTLVAVLDENPEVGLAYCQSVVVNESEDQLGTREVCDTDLDPSLWLNDFVINGRQFVEEYLLFENVIPNASAVLIRKETWDNVGDADDAMKLAGDWLQWVKILGISDVAFVAQPLNYYRTHSNTVRTLSTRSMGQFIEKYRVIDYIKKHFSADPVCVQRRLSHLTREWLEWTFGQHQPETTRLLSVARMYLRVAKYDPQLNSQVLPFLENYYSGFF